jgi:serine kinase of HPr protein (carbohydrate metabolism regulator)
VTALQPLHATAVALHGPRGWSGILLLGPSGSGKSDLALRLIEGGARLVADDATLVWAHSGGLHAVCPETIRGRMEVRGLGVLPAPTRQVTRLRLAVTCVTEPPERLPDRESWAHVGLSLPMIRVDARSPSAATVVRCALRTL